MRSRFNGELRSLPASAGSGWEGASDGFFYVHEPVARQAIYNWRLKFLEAANKDSSAGLMLRENLSPGSRFLCVSVTPTDEAALDGSGPGSAQVKVLYRAEPGAVPMELSGTRSIEGHALTNLGFTFFRSGQVVRVDWSAQLGSDSENLATVDVAAPIMSDWRIGIAVASHNNAPGFSSRAVSWLGQVHGDPITWPTLELEETEGALVVRWLTPLDAPYVLGSRPGFGPEDYWDPVTNKVRMTEGPLGVTNSVTVPLEQGNRFFGLKYGRF